MAKHTLDWGPDITGVPQFTIFRNITEDIDYLALNEEPSLPASLTSGYADFVWTSGGNQIHFRAEISGNTSVGIIAGSIDGLAHLPLGDGTVRVDHDYGGTDNLRILDSNTNAAIDNAFIWIYIADDYNIGNTDKTKYLKAWTVTRMDGRWNESLYLDPASYVLLVTKAGANPVTKNLTVIAVIP